MSQTVKVISFTILHDEGWSRETEKYDVSAQPINKYFSKGSFSFDLLLWGNDVQSFLEELKEKRQIISMDVVGVTKKFGLLRLKHRSGGTISSLARRFGGIIVSEYVNDGLENWKIVLRSRSARKFRERLTDYGNVVKYREEMLRDFTDLPSPSQRQLQILEAALRAGYFDYPKKIRSDELAKSLGMTPATLVYHLRNAEREILEFYVSTFSSQ